MMKHMTLKAKFLFFVCWLLLTAAAVHAAGGDETDLSYGDFGRLNLYRTAARPAQVVIMVSGQDGWNEIMAGLALETAAMDALVVGIDGAHFRKQVQSSDSDCIYPAADFEGLSKYVQKQFLFPKYIRPILVGQDFGAALAYAVAAQAPPNTFKAVLSLGFCPELALNRELCQANALSMTKKDSPQGNRLAPAKNFPEPWIILHGEADRTCTLSAAAAFAKEVPAAEIIALPGVNHLFSNPDNWRPQFKQTLSRLMAAQHSVDKLQLGDLPVVEIPARIQAGEHLAVIVSGDGGWADLDREVGEDLAAKGIAVVGLNALKYFWTARTPEGAAQDLGRILRHYLETWGKTDVALIGYSLGADVLPFMAARLPGDLRQRVRLIALLSPGRETAFEFHLSDWLGGACQSGTVPILPEVGKLGDCPVLCCYGKEEKDSLCTQPLPPSVQIKAFEGGHHLGGHYDVIADSIIAGMGKPSGSNSKPGRP